MNDSTPLPPDWARLEGGRPVPIGLPDDPEAPPKFSFDAVRTLVRLAEDPDPAGRQIAAVAWPVFEGQEPAQIPVEHDLSGEPAGDTRNPVVLVAAAGAADAAGEDERPGPAARRGRSRRPGVRRPTTARAWVALGRYMLTTKALEPSC